MEKSCIILFSWLIAMTLNIEFKIADIFPVQFFPISNFFLGFLGNFAYSIVMIFRSLLLLANEDKQAKVFNKYMWILLFTRPFGAASFNFAIAPLISIFLGAFNKDLGEITRGPGASIMIGIFLGLFFEYIISKAFFDTIWRKASKKIINDGNEI